MLVLGLLLILAAVAIGAGAIYDGGEDATFELFGQTIGTTISGVFLAGLFTMLLFFLGVWLLFASMGRARRRRAERKQAKARQRQSVSQIEEERAQLRAENERLSEELAAREAARRDGVSAEHPVGGTTDRTTDRTVVGGTEHAAPTDRGLDPLDTERPRHVEGDRVVDQHTDLTPREEPATSASGRHRDEV